MRCHGGSERCIFGDAARAVSSLAYAANTAKDCSHRTLVSAAVHVQRTSAGSATSPRPDTGCFCAGGCPVCAVSNGLYACDAYR
jgi:hypothetical protein